MLLASIGLTECMHKGPSNAGESTTPAVLLSSQKRATCDLIKRASRRERKLKLNVLLQGLNGRSYPVTGVIILLNWKLDAFYADVQDAGRGRVVLHRHPSVGSNLENKCISVMMSSQVALKSFCCSEAGNSRKCEHLYRLVRWLGVRPSHSGHVSVGFNVKRHNKCTFCMAAHRTSFPLW